jgi:glycosyltransferase involved in cell wall biosynthesis
MQHTGPTIHDNTRLSVIVRFHQEERLAFLEEAVFSLSIQDWRNLEVVIMLQNGTEELRRRVEAIVADQPWPDSPQYKIVIIPVGEGVDGRSVLLNQGIKNATGRYLAFLDDDDFVYQHGYATLIGQLVKGGRAIAVGGCRRAKIEYKSGHWFVQTKDNFFAWGRSRLDLIRENFVPVHSYVIDRARLGDFELYFDETFSILEDYDFLLRLCAQFEPDFSCFETPVCEYRIRLDGSNSIAHLPNAPAKVVAAQKRAQRLIKERKESLIHHMPAADLVKLKEGLLENVGERQADGNESYYVREIDAEAVVYEPASENRVLLKIIQDIYLFFSRYPDWEKRLSHTLHTGWRAYKRLRRQESRA